MLKSNKTNQRVKTVFTKRIKRKAASSILETLFAKELRHARAIIISAAVARVF